MARKKILGEKHGKNQRADLRRTGEGAKAQNHRGIRGKKRRPIQSSRRSHKNLGHQEAKLAKQTQSEQRQITG